MGYLSIVLLLVTLYFFSAVVKSIGFRKLGQQVVSEPPTILFYGEDKFNKMTRDESKNPRSSESIQKFRSDGASKHEVDRFNNTNDYGLWKVRMEAVLFKQGLEVALQGKEAIDGPDVEKNYING